jgi:hypothetical protein
MASMAAAHPIDFSTHDPETEAKRAWLAQQLETLTPEERARYAGDAFFRGLVETCFEQERRDPGGFERGIAVRRRYGEDVERELSDLDAGRHPFQQPR